MQLRPILGAALLSGAAACTAGDPVAGYLANPAALERGESVFSGSCGGYCHQIDITNADAPNLFDCEWRHGGSNREVFATIANGVVDTRMQGFAGKLPAGDADIWKIVAFLRSRSACP